MFCPSPYPLEGWRDGALPPSLPAMMPHSVCPLYCATHRRQARRGNPWIRERCGQHLRHSGSRPKDQEDVGERRGANKRARRSLLPHPRGLSQSHGRAGTCPHPSPGCTRGSKAAKRQDATGIKRSRNRAMPASPRDNRSQSKHPLRARGLSRCTCCTRRRRRLVPALPLLTTGTSASPSNRADHRAQRDATETRRARHRTRIVAAPVLVRHAQLQQDVFRYIPPYISTSFELCVLYTPQGAVDPDGGRPAWPRLMARLARCNNKTMPSGTNSGHHRHRTRG